jgi:DNA-binding MarR family transcriptional regulator
MATKTNELLEQWRDLEAAHAAHAAIRASLERALQREHQLTLSEYEVLDRIANTDEGHCRMQELTEDGSLTQSALSRLVQRLEDDGFVNRAVCEQDRRGVFAKITDAGRSAQRKAQSTYLSVLGETLS